MGWRPLIPTAPSYSRDPCALSLPRAVANTRVFNTTRLSLQVADAFFGIRRKEKHFIPFRLKVLSVAAQTALSVAMTSAKSLQQSRSGNPSAPSDSGRRAESVYRDESESWLVYVMCGSLLYRRTHTHKQNVNMEKSTGGGTRNRVRRLARSLFEEERRNLSLSLPRSSPPLRPRCSCAAVSAVSAGRVCACASRQSSVCAVVLQLGDDGDQVLQTKDVAAVQALVHHAVPVVMSAGGVGKIDHPHIHQGAAVI